MKRIILAAIATFSCTAAFAIEPSAYVSIGVGSAEQKISVPGASLSDDDTGFNVATGYRFTPNFGFEAGYTSFGTAKASVLDISGAMKSHSLYAAATGTYAVTPQIAFSGKLGVARNRSKLSSEGESVSEKDNSVMFGVGVSYAFTPNVALIAEYQNFGKLIKGDDGESIKANIVSAGLRFSF